MDVYKENIKARNIIITNTLRNVSTSYCELCYVIM